MAVVQRGVAPGETEAPLRTDGALTCGVGRHWLFESLGDGWEEALGWSRDELTSRPFTDFVHPGDRSEALAAVTGGDGAGEIVLETRFRARGGSWQRIRWVPTSDPGDAAPEPVVRERVVEVPAARTARPAIPAIAMACALALLVAVAFYDLTRAPVPTGPLGNVEASSFAVPHDAIGAPLVPAQSLVSRANSRSERH